MRISDWSSDVCSSDLMASIQLDLADVLSFHSYDNPAGFEARVDDLQPLGRPIMCTEYLARTEGSTIEGVLPVAKRRHVGAYTTSEERRGGKAGGRQFRIRGLPDH